MHVKAVVYHPSEFQDQVYILWYLETYPNAVFQLYHDALSCVDRETQTKVQKFYHREDACRKFLFQSLTPNISHVGHRK